MAKASEQTERMDKQQLRAVAKMIATELNKGQILCSAATIANMADFAPGSTPVRKILEDPTFPKAAEITEGGHKRWLTSKVVKWFENRVESFEKREAELLMSA